MLIEPMTHWSELEQFLASCGLVVTDIDDSGDLAFFGMRSKSRLIGVVGLEIFTSVALLRSLAVCPEQRSAELGKGLVDYAERHAASECVNSLYLLTNTAESYFSGLGYRVINRDEAPLSIKESSQFLDICPANAAFMWKQL